MYDCAYAVPVMTAKCKLITLPHITRVHNYTMPGKKAGERKKKERSGGNVSRHSKKAKQVGDDSLTGPVVAGRLVETTGKHIR